MSGDVFYYGMHVLGIIAIIIYIAIISPKFNESRFRSIVCGMLSYATIYALMLFLFYLVTGVFGGQNVIRTFIFLPLIIIAYSKLLRLNTRHLLDMLAPCIPMAQVLGKIGCQYVGCCQSWIRVDWGIINPITNERLFPIQLIEGIVALLVVIIVIVYMRKKNYQANGLAMPLSMLLFGGSRFFLEFLRDNEKVIGNISELALWCVAMVIASIIWIAIYKSKEKKGVFIMKKSLIIVLCICLSACMLTACGKKPRSMRFSSELTEDNRIYYVGENLDAYAVIDGEKICKIPHIYIEYSDGTESEDVSHSENIKFSDFDSSEEGEQVVTVEYTENGTTIEDSYKVDVIASEILFIEASDPWHYKNGAFKVGDKFSTYQNENGVERGVTVFISYVDENRGREGFFTNNPKMAELIVDTSDCYLDSDGKFTQAGEYTIKLNYKNFSTSYQIRVTE